MKLLPTHADTNFGRKGHTLSLLMRPKMNDCSQLNPTLTLAVKSISNFTKEIPPFSTKTGT